MNSTLTLIEQLLPLERLQSALRRFTASIEMGCLILNGEGAVVFESSWCCSPECRQTTSGAQPLHSCLKSPCVTGACPSPGSTSFVFTCDNGLQCIGAPVIVEGYHVVTLYIGPFSHAFADAEQGERNDFGCSGDYGADNRAPVLTESQLAKLTDRLEIMVELLTEMGRNTILERQSAQQLQKSEERYRNLIDSFPLVVYETDRQGRIVFANNNALEYFNCTQEDIVRGVDLFTFVPPHEQSKVAQRLNLLLAGHQLEPEEYSFPRKDGSKSSMLVYSRAISVNGTISGIRGTFIDITKRKKTEERLQASEQRYRTLFETAHDAILLLGGEIIIECNEEAQNLFQRSEQDLLGANIASFSPVQQVDGQPSVANLQQRIALAEQGEQQRFDWNILQADGNIRETEVSLSGFIVDGKPYVIALFRDITERNQSKRTLEERESAWQAIFKHAPYGIVINRLSDGVYLDANPAYELYGGRSRVDTLGKTPIDFLAPEQLEKHHQARAALLAGGSLHNHEAKTVAQDGTARHVLYSSAVFQAGGEPCAVSMFVDITERKEMEERLRHNENVLNSLFQAVPVGLAILKERCFLAINEQVSVITGYAMDELLNCTSRFLYENEKEFYRVGQELYDALWQRGSGYVETKFKRKDGSLCHVSLYAAPLDHNNPEAGAAVAIQDITERTAMLQSVRNSEYRFRKIADLTGQLIYDYDVASGSIYWSGLIEEITGYSTEAFNSFGFNGWMERVHPNDRAEALARLEAASREQCNYSFEYRFQRADQSYFYVHEEGAYLYDEHDKPFRMLGTIKDVSTRKAAEEALRRSEERLGHAISATSDAIWEWYPQEQRTYYGPRWYEMLGYGNLDLPMTYASWAERCHPDDLQVAEKIMRTALASPSNPQFSIECRLRHRLGHWIWILSRGKVMERDRTGVALLVTGTNTDITKHKLAEFALRDSEHRYRALFESGNDAIFILRDDRVADCNNRSLEMFRCTRDQFLGLSPQQFSPPIQPDGRTFAEHGLDYIANALHGNPQQFEWVHSRLDGAIFNADVRLGAVELSGETCVQAIIRDITEWKKTEGALRESEFRFRSFFNTSPEGILLIDFQGLILDINKAFLQESGYGLHESIGKHFREFVSSEDQGQIVEAILSFKSGVARNEPLRFSYIAKDGSRVPVMAKGWLVVDEKSTPLYLGVFIHNLSKELALADEKAALEKQVIQSQRSEAIGTLAGGIAHDFNNILGGIIGYTELAILRASSSTDGKTGDYLRRILEGSNRAKDLVQQILRFSRHTTMVMEPFNLMPVIKESIHLLRSTLPSTISIRHHLEQNVDRILGDPTQIHQVVMNLGTNALHAMKENGGQLTITLKNVFIDEPRQFMSMAIPAGEYLHLEVSDTGCGMPPAVVERIFEPYFTTKKINEGTGLGMAVVQGIIKSHQGLIEIKSTVGSGTRFDIYLPTTQENATQCVHVPSPLPMGRGERVLLVDDEPFFLEIIRESLQLLGYRVTACGSSINALHRFSDAPGDFDLLITDQTMPEMTGVQLVREVRRIDKELPIILCTGYSEIVSEQSAAYYGINRFLMKPVNTSDLAQAVAAILTK